VIAEFPTIFRIVDTVASKSIFEKIIDGDVPATFEYVDDHCVVIRDIAAQAPIHCLVIPKKPIERLARAGEEDEALLGHLLLVAQKIAVRLEIIGGYRVVINNGRDAGETVPYLHIHLLGGRPMAWPPG
jgi:histidine triad (HIT) family protein